MFNEPGHPDVSLADWNIFRNQFSPFLFSEVIDRRKVKLPEWFLPLARGAALPSDYLLSRAGYAKGKHCPRGWKQSERGVYRKSFDFGTALVRKCGNQRLWSVERFRAARKYTESDRVLAFLFGSTPVLARKHQAAMYLAEWIFENDLPSGLNWADTCPDDKERAVRFARSRRAREEATTSP